ncbi:MAG TPA: xanthine dehydrogenase family protein subunit M [Limnochordales bacterium]
MACRFGFTAATSLAEALAALAARGPGALPLAGGTDLGVLLRRRKVAPSHLVFVARVPELRRLEWDGPELVVGAAVTHRAVEKSPLFAGPLRALPEACSTVGGVQVRNVGTVGGNLCNASPAADTPPALVALGARVTIVGPQGSRQLPLEEFFLGYRRTAVQPGELLLEVRIPRPQERSGSAFVKLGRRRAMEISIVCVAVSVTLEDDGVTCRQARIGLGSVAETTLRARQAEEVLRGRPLVPEVLREAGQAAAAECSPIDDLRATAGYRRRAVAVLVERAAALAAQRARQQAGLPDEAGRDR